jgi:hypothetical protein
MCWRGSLVALIALPLAVAACAKDSVKQPECKPFQFEGGVTTNIRADAVKSLDAMFVLGGRRRLFSMELELPDKGQRDHLNEVHLSAFFRPLQANAVECQDFDEIGATRCYVSLPNASMQVSAVFDRNSQIDFPAAMREVAVQVERSALNCN